MNELEIALFVIIIGATGTCIVAGTTVAFLISNRVTALETEFKFWSAVMERITKTAIQVMHSPHTPELDSLIEKYQKGGMSDNDWRSMLRLVEGEERNLNNPRFERALASFVAIHCRKRLGLPLDEFHKHSETTK